MSLGEIAELISMYDPDTNNRKQMELLIEKIIERRHQLESQKEELERMIVDLKAWEQRSRRAMKGKNKTRRES